MNKLNYILYSLGILSLLSYFPLMIYFGAVWGPKLSGQYSNLILLAIPAPVVLGFVLMVIASSGFRKTKKIRLENQLEKSEKLSQMNVGELAKLKAESVNYSSAEIEGMRKKVLKLQNVNLYFSFGFLFLFFFLVPIFTALIPNSLGSNFYFSVVINLLLVLAYIKIVPDFNKKISKLKTTIKTWILEHRIKIPNISNLQFIPKNIGQNLRSLLFVSKMCQINSNLEGFGIDEVMAFEYKTKTIELIDFWIKSSSKNSKPHFYLCLTTTNPDQIEGRTVAWRDSNWRFKDDKISEKVGTESPVFDRIFKTFASDQINARMHLNTSIMQDMIELQQALVKKKCGFLF